MGYRKGITGFKIRPVGQAVPRNLGRMICGYCGKAARA
jgi:hypothetical protein